MDLGLSVALHFSGGRLANFVTDLRVDLPCDAVVIGTEGSIKVKLGYVDNSNDFTYYLCAVID